VFSKTSVGTLKIYNLWQIYVNFIALRRIITRNVREALLKLYLGNLNEHRYMAGSGYLQKRVNIRINVTLRRVRVRVVAVEKQ